MFFPRRKRSALVLPVVAWSLAIVAGPGCDEHDVGRTCQAKPAPTLPAEPVGGEQPVEEIVSVQRNGDCESFQCLIHGGYTPYCTRACEYKNDSRKGECTTNADCRTPLHCFEGLCQDDDCPDGFECRKVQEAGPLSSQLFCVHKENCSENYDCESLGEVECNTVACFDQTLLGQEGVTDHVLTCLPEKDVIGFCFCEGSAANTALTCDHPICDPDTGGVWPASSVEVRRVCERK